MEPIKDSQVLEYSKLVTNIDVDDHVQVALPQQLCSPNFKQSLYVLNVQDSCSALLGI